MAENENYERMLQQAERGVSPTTMGENVREQGRARREGSEGGQREGSVADVFRNLSRVTSTRKNPRDSRE